MYEGISINYINPLKDPGPLLLTVEKPGRYAGGEYGRLAKKDLPFKMLIAFPDLYEIGMSNQAFRIIYNKLNHIDGISCDRAFAPAPDFEALLKKQKLPLYGLDTGISLKDVDVLMFTFGYELGITGVLSMLDVSSIPLHSAERTETDPIVIMGGPCVSNPLPYAAFADAFWIGEAEAGFFDLSRRLMELKRAGEGRSVLLEHLKKHPSIWAAGKGRAVRAIDSGFASRPPDASVFPISSMKTVQHHGAVEIMRGCPNGCRFCHAGFWYRPMRQKNAETLFAETAAFINEGGYREISLSSLSTGDYTGIDDLVEKLDREFGPRHVSFQLPSLKISSFSLELLEKVSRTRKSGLTFAVETPAEEWQRGINKEVKKDSVISILREARKNGWRGAKFYFMIGLPPAHNAADTANGAASEEKEIVDFIFDIGKQTGMNFNITVGAFVPKPHTPYQRAQQIGEEEARQKLDFIRSALKTRGHRTGIQDPFFSVLEGLIARGDERVGPLLETAFRQGCRLDAWSEHFKKPVWQKILDDNASLLRETLAVRPEDSPLPWDFIEQGVEQNFIKNECAKSSAGELTSPCMEKCTHNCGICHHGTKIVQNIIQHEVNSQENSPPIVRNNIQDEVTSQARDTKLVQKSIQGEPNSHLKAPSYRILFSFTKTGPAIFHSHLSLMEIFSMAITRSNLPVLFSEGFNPLPRLEIAAPLALGIVSRGEIALTEVAEYIPAEDFQSRLNEKLPDGIIITRAQNITIPFGAKKHSLALLLWGSIYRRPNYPDPDSRDAVKTTDDKQYRLSFLPELPERLTVLARSPGGTGETTGESYFDVYQGLYPDN
ncbi:B12-binding protein [Spirochaetia bacterium]|nr:B12-binding protein [Spirochaetia bacterium]